MLTQWKETNKDVPQLDKDNPVEVATANTMACLWRIKEERMAAKTKQSIISFLGVLFMETPALSADKAATRHTVAGRIQTMIKQIEEFIQCGAKATPVLAPK